MRVQEETTALLPKIRFLETPNFRGVLKDEVHHVYQLASPVVMTYVLELTPGLTSLILVGQMVADDTKKYVDAAALSVMYLNLTALSVGIGLATAMDTLCAQAYGAGNIKHIGLYLQTGAIVLLAAFLPVFLVNIFSADILVFLQQPEDVAQLAGSFSRVMALGLPFLYAYELLKKVLQCQNITWPMLYSAIICNVVNVVFGYILVNHTSCGYMGAAISRTIGNMALPLSLVPYFCDRKNIEFWPGWQLESACRGIPEFIYFGLAGMLMMIFEWWSFEIIALLSGLLPYAKVAIGANAVLVNITATLNMFYLGIAVAGNIRVGNALGANQPKRAQVSALTAVALGGIVSIITGICVYAFRYTYPRFFTQDTGMLDLAAQVAVVVAGFQFVNAVNSAVQGTLRGCGLQNYGAVINFVSYICFGLPMGYMFEFEFNYGLPGLWIGMTLGYLCAMICGTLILCQSNWQHLANKAHERAFSK
ncbi:Multidrug/Oligosaccharidyl-lipid/Polysaccharide (MOP) Flippase Superfamily [Thraustotheca clavata]|uniref:Multidrug/Oligosaccharidyl-lipid/Polysaccharide (MOP) Flippase Superfamily n=1 Tax=Thraustotheca clavata TaxID=74557 RepID=A0A1V9ZYS3_9STRA|nr:Multidrug/Oligosaccharidyl-lipid/Polysaccharide (MOP) Flippase Superfamily [Thraustotheca clavata]